MVFTNYFNRGLDFIHKEISIYRGYKTKRHIIVFESDDWGSMAVPDIHVYTILKNAGVHMDRSIYSKYDTLEFVQDFDNLYEVLNSVKDSNNHTCIMTLNYLMANPDFDAIRKSDFSSYSYNTIDDTYIQYQRGDVINKVKEGIEKGYVFPQLHGREHLNVSLWLRYLRSGLKPMQIAFDHNMFAVANNSLDKPIESIKRSLYPKNSEELKINECQIKEAQLLFEKIWGFKSDSFVGPNYSWHPSLEKTFVQNNIKYIQGGYKQYYFNFNTGKPERIFHYTGERINSGLLCSIRNIEFEPSCNTNISHVDSTMAQIKKCFRNNNPCVISTHRVNYCSGLSQDNRDNSLRQLRQLLKKIVEKYPEVEFMSSVKFFNYLEESILLQ